MHNRIAYVLTVGFGAKDEAPIQLALDEVLKLEPSRVIVVHDRKGSSGQCAAAAVVSRGVLFKDADVPLELMPVHQDETTLRWRAGVVESAFTDPAVGMVFVRLRHRFRQSSNRCCSRRVAADDRRRGPECLGRG